MKCSSSCRRRRASAKTIVVASISTRRACAASSKRCSLCPPHPRLHRLRGGGSGARTQQAKPITVRSPPRCLYLKKLRGKHNHPPDRPHPPLRAAAETRSQGYDCPPRSPRQSHQTPARRRSALRPKRGGTQPKTGSITLRCHQAAMKGVFHELGLDA